jgi:hypothetical protein
MQEAKDIISSCINGKSSKRIIEDDLMRDVTDKPLSRHDLSLIVESVCIDLYASLQLLRLNTMDESRSKIDDCLTSLNTIIETVQDI